MMRFPLVTCLALVGFAPIVAGCAAQTSRFPSLLPRAIEKRSDAERSAPAVVLVADSALDSQVSEIAKTVETSATAFGPAATRAQAAAGAARGDAVGGERWIAAQSALAELDGYRADTASSLTDLEQLAIGRSAANQPPYPALETLHARTEAQLTEQSGRIAALQAGLPSK